MNINPPLYSPKPVVTVTEDDDDLNIDALLLDDSFSETQETIETEPVAACSQQPTARILAVEEDTYPTNSEWILPRLSQPGDFLSNSIHRVPSKSILKKVSSYGNFDINESISSSKLSGGMKKKPSYLSFDVSINNGGDSTSGRSKGSDYGLDLDSSSQSQNSTFLSNSIRRVPSKSILKKVSSYGNFDINESISSSKLSGGKKKKPSYLSFDVSINNGGDSTSGRSKGSDYGLDLDSSSQSQNSTSFFGLTSSPCLVPDVAAQAVEFNADIAAGTLDTSIGSSNISTSGRMRRNVSFHAVNVREYDRTIGDNPSCKSGPPLSLDWSYSHATTKSIDDFELERSTERVRQTGRLRVHKYHRRNMLAFHWGHSHEEMKEARNKTKKLQRQRSLTQMLLPIHMAHEVCLSFKNFVTQKQCHRNFSEDNMNELSSSISKHIESVNQIRNTR